MDKKELKVGDLIRFHSWEVGGFLLGVIIEHEDEIYHSKLNIWRSGGIYLLQSNGIDGIDVIHSSKDIPDYEQYDFNEIIKEIQNNNIFVNVQIPV